MTLRDGGRAGFAAVCRQCEQWQGVALIRRGYRRARYWCRLCGAVVTLRGPAGLAELRPVSELTQSHPGPASAPPPAPGQPELLEVMPAAMLAWADTALRKPLRPDRLDKAMMYQLYRQWDEHRATLVDPVPPAGLPAFSTVVGAQHDNCYHSDRVLEALAPAAPGPARLAVWQRAEHARRWLARRAPSLCWISPDADPQTLAQPDRAEVAAAAEAVRTGAELTREDAAVVREALFGTRRGPGIAQLRAVFPDPELLAGLAAYLESGERPLRAEVLGRLAAPPAPGEQAGT